MVLCHGPQTGSTWTLGYGMRWCSDYMTLTYNSTEDLNGTIPISKVTWETPDISEFLDFGFYDYLWYKDNTGLGTQLPGR